MRTVNEQKQELARALFFQSGKSQGEIAAEVGVSDKTLYLWTREGDWHRLRSASNLMPSLIIENFYAQVQELNNDIRSREPGKRYPSLQEAEIFRKMMLTIDRSKKKATQSEYMELFQKFISWMVPKSHEHSQLFTNYADSFLKSQATQGFHPYDIEYEEPIPAFENSNGDIGQAGESEEYYTEPTEQDFAIAALRGTARLDDISVKQSHDNIEEMNEVEAAIPGSNADVSVKEELERLSTPPLSNPNDPSEIIGNYETQQQPSENQSLDVENTNSGDDGSVIINESETGNNNQAVQDPHDLYKGLSAGQAYQKYLALKKEKELNKPPEERATEQPPKEETQLFSIGGKVFTMRVNKK